MIEIKEVHSKKDLKTFINFPVKLYKDAPYFTPLLMMDEMNCLDVKKNPASTYCKFKLLLAYKDGKLVGRICGIINNFANQKYNQKRVRFNRLDMIDDIEVTKVLIGAIEAWGKENGLEEINGPLGYSDQDKEGLLTKGFDQLNMFITCYTHEYYVRHLKELGFVEDAKWNEYKIFIPKEVDPRIAKLAKRVEERYNLHMVHLKSKRHIKNYVMKALYLVNECYKDLYGYVPIDDDQIRHLAAQYVPLINLDYLQLVETEDKRIVGLGLMVPSPALAVKKSKGRLFPFGWIGFFKALKKSKVLEMLLVAVDPAYQNKGVNAMIITEAVNNAIKNKVEYAETGPELQTNVPVQSLWKTFESEHHKERHCFLKPITK